jgi:hypothetical protein
MRGLSSPDQTQAGQLNVLEVATFPGSTEVQSTVTIHVSKKHVGLISTVGDCFVLDRQYLDQPTSR